MATEGDIHFPPGQRRDKPTFEPPPWEREQFEELSKRKTQKNPEPAVAETTVAPAVQPGAQTAAAAAEVLQTGEESEGTPQLDEKQVELLMMGLRAEEPLPHEGYRRITIAAGVVCALIGVLLATWAVVGLTAFKEGNMAQWFFVLVLLMFGIGFIAAGGWLVYRTLRQQGVL